MVSCPVKIMMKRCLPFVFFVVSITWFPSASFSKDSSDNSPVISTAESSMESLFTLEELQWLENKPELAYVYDPDWAPFEWKNDIDKHTGIIADILSIVNKRTGIEFIPVNTDTWDESVRLVKNGNVKMFSAITKNSAREEYLDFTSRDIYTYPAVLITRFDDKAVYLNIEKDFKGKKIGIVKGSGLGQYIKENHPGLEYVELPATRDGFSSLRNNEIDLFAINTVTAKYFIEKKGYDDLKIALKLDYIYHLKIAIRKDMPAEFISVIDKALGGIKEETLNDIFNKWTESTVKQQTNWEMVFQITSVLFAVILLLAWSNRRLNLKVEERTRQLSSINVELQKSLEQTQKANNTKSLFLANVSHEIRTPLNGVLGMVQVLQGTTLNDEQKHYLEALDSSGNLLLLLIDDLLDLSKIESGKLLLDIESFRVYDWITDIQNIAEPLFENKNVVFTTEIDEEVPEYLEGDATRLMQIVINLISNAAKYTHEGEVEFVVSGQYESESQFLLQVAVKDTGVGIEESKLDRIFDAFHQLEPDIVKNKGVGLGLAICKRLADIMRGYLEVSSVPGAGSCFNFSMALPVPAENRSSKSSDTELEFNKILSILLVDDDAINRLAARTLLKQAGHKVIEAEDGQAAINKAKETGFDVILMDIHMPVMDGIAATKIIRENNEGYRQVPIIGLTASVMANEKERYLAAGMNAVVAKPIVIKKLMKIIQKSMDERDSSL